MRFPKSIPDSNHGERRRQCLGAQSIPRFDTVPMIWQERIEMTPDVLNGKPVVTGTRIPVELVVELLAQDWSTDKILEQYPACSREDIQACLHYAGERLQSERVYPMEKTPEA